MTAKQTNVLNIALLIFCLTLEISFTHSVRLNLLLVVAALIFLLSQKACKWVLVLLVLPFFPALSSYWSVRINGVNDAYAWLLFSRTYAFAALGIVFLNGVDLEELLLFLEQWKLPPNFVYGILVVVHALPQIKREIQALKEASLLRGKALHFYSPMIYLKVIFIAFSWRDQYVEAMYSRGYTEEAPRRVQQALHNSKKGLIASVVFFVLVNLMSL